MTARLITDGLASELGQPVVVEPRPGAAGMIAVNDLLAAPHDGHTALLCVNSVVSEVPHFLRLRLDLSSAIVPLAEVARGGLVLVATPALVPTTLHELVAYAKGNPGKLSYASYSPGTMSQILGLLLNEAAGIDLAHVGYSGSTPALAAVMAGHVPLMFDAMPSALPLIRAGKLKALAVSTPQRTPFLPQVPTFIELGFTQMEAVAWIGLWVPLDVPADVQARLRAAALKVVSTPQMRARLAQLGFEQGQQRSTEVLQQALRADYERVGAVLKSIGFRPA
jgi:tripartite-type tricarboxylate transporter receptor subunit TctC